MKVNCKIVLSFITNNSIIRSNFYPS